MSFDTPQANSAFKQEQGFQFPLWSDEDRDLAMFYGAASAPKDLFASRITVVLDPQGTWQLVYPSPGGTGSGLYGHAQDVLDDLTVILAP